jgi:hypothetical protein
MSALISLSSVLRFLMLALLVAGVLVRPVLAVECDIRDAQQSVAAGHLQTAGTEAPSPHEDCCSLPNCSDCCAHIAALLPPFGVAAAVPMTAAVLPALSVDFEPIAFPVAFRPPIAA